MGGSILENCGQYSSRLQKLTQDILILKYKNGNPVTNLDKDALELELFAAYQKILSIANDGISISEAIRSLEITIKSTGRTDFEKIATTAAFEAVVAQENSNKNNSSEHFKTNIDEQPVNLWEKIQLSSSLEKIEEGKAIINDVFDEEMLSGLSEKLLSAKKGDVEAAGIVATIKQATLFMGKYPEIDEPKTRAALCWMQRLMHSGDLDAIRVAEKMARQYKLDLFETREDDAVILSQEKLDKIYEEKVINYKNGSVKKPNFIDVNKTAGEIFIHKGMVFNIDEFKTQVSNEFIKYHINQACNQITMLENNFEDTKKFLEIYKDFTKDLLTSKLESYGKTQLLSSKRKDELQSQIMMMNEIVSGFKKREDDDLENVQENSTISMGTIELGNTLQEKSEDTERD